MDVISTARRIWSKTTDIGVVYSQLGKGCILLYFPQLGWILSGAPLSNPPFFQSLGWFINSIWSHEYLLFFLGGQLTSPQVSCAWRHCSFFEMPAASCWRIWSNNLGLKKMWARGCSKKKHGVLMLKCWWLGWRHVRLDGSFWDSSFHYVVSTPSFFRLFWLRFGYY